MNVEFSRQIFEKYSNIKFHENMSGGTGVFSCEQTDTWTDGRTDRKTDAKRLIVVFRNFASAPTNSKPTSASLRIVGKVLQLSAWTDAVF